MQYPVGLRFCVLAFLLCFQSAVSAETLRLVTERWPPLIDKVDGQSDGPLWAITKTVLERMGYEPQLRFTPWKRALDLVARNRADAVVGASRTAAREKKFLFPDTPLLDSESTLFSRRASPVSFKNFDDLSGMTIGLSAGYSYSEDVTAASGVTWEEVKNIQSGLQMVLMGRVDAFIANRDVGRYEARKLGIADQLTDSPTPISSGPVYLMFSPETSPAFLRAFDRELKSFRHSDEYHRLVRNGETPDTPDTPDTAH